MFLLLVLLAVTMLEVTSLVLVSLKLVWLEFEADVEFKVLAFHTLRNKSCVSFVMFDCLHFVIMMLYFLELYLINKNLMGRAAMIKIDAI